MEAAGNLGVKSVAVARAEGAGKGMTGGVARSVEGKGTTRGRHALRVVGPEGDVRAGRGVLGRCGTGAERGTRGKHELGRAFGPGTGLRKGGERLGRWRKTLSWVGLASYFLSFSISN
jgi:hypothetical protein